MIDKQYGLSLDGAILAYVLLIFIVSTCIVVAL